MLVLAAQTMVVTVNYPHALACHILDIHTEITSLLPVTNFITES